MKKFLYKIYSSYNGFFPKRIPERLIEGNVLQLNWQRYIDAVDIGDEVWVYFHGPHKFENGVYVKGIVKEINAQNLRVYIRIREYSTNKPLTNAEISQQVAQVVATQYRQVFLYPQEWLTVPNCNIQSTAVSCNHHLCEECPFWNGLSLINEKDYKNPERFSNKISGFVPAFWIRTKRGHLYGNASLSVRRTSEIFYRFKTGDKALAFPLALGIFESFRKRKDIIFDGIVPIPLSPDKAEAGEINRTLLLANELAKLLGIKVVNALSLKKPISKRRLIGAGYSKALFESVYNRTLSVSNIIAPFRKILLLDDVCTNGSTLRAAADRIKEVNPKCRIFAVTAGQMIVKNVVLNDEAITN